MVSHSEHIREIERVSRGLPVRRDETVVKSWLRCLEHHRLDPAQVVKPISFRKRDLGNTANNRRI